jgi:hypothetical protein
MPKKKGKDRGVNGPSAGTAVIPEAAITGACRRGSIKELQRMAK